MYAATHTTQMKRKHRPLKSMCLEQAWLKSALKLQAREGPIHKFTSSGYREEASEFKVI